MIERLTKIFTMLDAGLETVLTLVGVITAVVVLNYILVLMPYLEGIMKIIAGM